MTYYLNRDNIKEYEPHRWKMMAYYFDKKIEVSIYKLYELNQLYTQKRESEFANRVKSFIKEMKNRFNLFKVTSFNLFKKYQKSMKKDIFLLKLKLFSSRNFYEYMNRELNKLNYIDIEEFRYSRELISKLNSNRRDRDHLEDIEIKELGLKFLSYTISARCNGILSLEEFQKEMPFFKECMNLINNNCEAKNIKDYLKKVKRDYLRDIEKKLNLILESSLNLIDGNLSIEDKKYKNVNREYLSKYSLRELNEKFNYYASLARENEFYSEKFERDGLKEKNIFIYNIFDKICSGADRELILNTQKPYIKAYLQDIKIKFEIISTGFIKIIEGYNPKFLALILNSYLEFNERCVKNEYFNLYDENYIYNINRFKYKAPIDREYKVFKNEYFETNEIINEEFFERISKDETIFKILTLARVFRFNSSKNIDKIVKKLIEEERNIFFKYALENLNSEDLIPKLI